jgi:signal transduction histidine kinase
MQRLQIAGTLASGIAHDMNNELTLVLGNLDVAIDRLPSGYDLHDWLALAKTAAGRCADMSRRLLDLSRPPRPSMTRLRVESLVEEARVMLECIKPPNTTIDIDVESDLEIDGNEMQIQQVLINLGTNSFHAMPGGGVLRISAGRDLDHVRIAVSDSGCGIPPSMQKRIFDPFFTTRADAGGSGLGLTSAQNIMHNHAGSITVDSLLNEGSTFTLEFPAPEPELDPEE